MKYRVWLLSLGLVSGGVQAAPIPPAGKLTTIRERILNLEGQMIDGVKNQNNTKVNLGRIKTLIQLQRQEAELGKQRVAQLEQTIAELQERRAILNEKVVIQKMQLRQLLRDLRGTTQETADRRQMSQQDAGARHERDGIEAVRQRVLRNLVDRGLKEVETLKVDLADADHLEQIIQGEQQQLTYLFQDLKEREEILELNRRLQVDMLKEKHAERLLQLENYRKLKSSEEKVERLITDFNARLELEREVETERVVSRDMMRGTFGRLKGSLPLPVAGSVVSEFGRSFDPASKLYVFKKGVDIQAPADSVVKAISAGKIAFTGEVPNLGKVAIVDHGDHFYSICGNLGDIKKKSGETVVAGDVVGVANSAGLPVYFEIRSRNIALNPLQWVAR